MANFSNEWMKSLREAASKRDATTRYVTAQLGVIHKEILALGERAERLEASLSRAEDEFRERFGQLVNLRDDPAVLVRTYGANRRYHSASRPCGWVREPSNYERILLSEAARRGYLGCDSCSWYARNAA